MEDLTCAFRYKAPDLPITSTDDFMDSEAIRNLTYSLQNHWSACGVDDRSASFLADDINEGISTSASFLADDIEEGISTSASFLADYIEKGISMYDSFLTDDIEGISMPAPAPASSQLCNGRRRGCLLSANEYLNDYGSNSQFTSVRMNSGFGASSTKNWVGQEILWGHNLARTATSPERTSTHILNRGLYNYRMASRRASHYQHQPSLSTAFLEKESDFEALEDSDILLLGKTKSGSLSLQQALSWQNLRVTNRIFEALMRHVFDLITNQFGHYLFLKLIQSCNEDQLNRIIVTVTGQYDLFYTASIDHHGSQSIKKLIKMLAGLPLVSHVMIALCSRFKQIMTNRTGATVVMQCVKTLDDEQNKLLYEAVIKNFLGIAANNVGCVYFNDLIDNVRGPYRQQLLNLVCDHAAFLSNDPSGNFILQHAIELHNPDLTERICSKLKGKYVELSMLQCASHLVEKCLKSRGMAHYVVTDFLRISDQQLLKVAGHKFGNFVIQTAMKVTKSADSSLHEALLVKLRGLNALQHGYAKNVYYLIANGVPVKDNIFLN